VVGSNPKLYYSLTIYYTDPTGKNTKTVIQVPGIVSAPGNPTVAQATAASAAKQAAIIAAINAAMIPIKPVMIGGVTYSTLTATANKGTVPGGVYPVGGGATMPKNLVVAGKIVGVVQVPAEAPAAFATFTVNGMTQKVMDPGTAAAKLVNGVFRTAGNTVTGELGNGQGTFTPGRTPSSGSMMGSAGSSLQQAIFFGLGASAGLTTGLDYSGDPSVVGIGFIDETSSTPIDYIAAFDPTAGMDDEQVFTDLSELFNEDYSSDGYTSTYDPTTDTLTINQPLPAGDYTWVSDSDTGLYIQDTFETTPEPDSMLLLGTGLAGLVTFLRQKRARA
jgi:hypothetical protein